MYTSQSSHRILQDAYGHVTEVIICFVNKLGGVFTAADSDIDVTARHHAEMTAVSGTAPPTSTDTVSSCRRRATGLILATQSTVTFTSSHSQPFQVQLLRYDKYNVIYIGRSSTGWQRRTA